MKNTTTIRAELAAYLSSGCEYFSLPDFSLNIIRDNDILATYEQTNNPTASPLYKIGSLTKLVTGLIVLQLQEEGLLDIEHKVAQYLPWFDAPGNDINNNITILELLLHTSGIARGRILKQDPTQADAMEMLSDGDGLFAPEYRGRFKYSNLGYILLGFVIEKVTNERYTALVKSRVFETLGMNESGFGATGIVDNMSQPNGPSYFFEYNQSPCDHAPIPLMAAPYASFDMHAPISDFTKLLMCVLNQGVYDNKKVFTTNVIDRLFSIYSPINAKLDSTIGLMKMQAYGSVMFFQNAEHWGHSASMLLMPGKKLGIVAMAGRGAAGLDLWTMLKTVLKYTCRNYDNECLTFNYTDYPDVLGTYRNEQHGDICITGDSRQLLLSTEEDSACPMIYKGQHSFLLAHGSLRKYITTLDMQKGKVKGLFVGPYYYERNSNNHLAASMPRHEVLTGIYVNDVVGRIALFERRGKLVLAYSPEKESVLEAKSDSLFLQVTGPFIGEQITIAAGEQVLETGGLKFRKLENAKY